MTTTSSAPRLEATTGDQRLGTARWMNSSASMNGDGLIHGRTRIWCRWHIRGFTGSVVPVLLDRDGRVLWGGTDAEKHRYGVDGRSVPFKKSDRTVRWQNQVPAGVWSSGRVDRLVLVQYLDPTGRVLAAVGNLVEQAIEVLIEETRRRLAEEPGGEYTPGSDAGVIWN